MFFGKFLRVKRNTKGCATSSAFLTRMQTITHASSMRGFTIGKKYRPLNLDLQVLCRPFFDRRNGPGLQFRVKRLGIKAEIHRHLH